MPSPPHPHARPAPLPANQLRMTGDQAHGLGHDGLIAGLRGYSPSHQLDVPGASWGCLEGMA
jgi:hypothetical protein